MIVRSTMNAAFLAQSRLRPIPRAPAALVLCLLLLLAGCSSGQATTEAGNEAENEVENEVGSEGAPADGSPADRSPRWIVRPDETGSLPADVLVGCPSGPSFPASALAETRPLAGSGLDEVEREVLGFLGNEEGQHWPQNSWLVLHQSEDQVLVVSAGDEPGRADSGLAFMTVERRDGQWRWSGSSSGGDCPLVTRLPEGLNTVEWRLDPAAPATGAGDTDLRILATERECVSGQAMGERLLGPEIVYTADAILLAFAAEPPPGDAQTCPGNPEQAVTVTLAEPLGDREVLDGLAMAGDLADYLPGGD